MGRVQVLAKDNTGHDALTVHPEVEVTSNDALISADQNLPIQVLREVCHGEPVPVSGTEGTWGPLGPANDKRPLEILLDHQDVLPLGLRGSQLPECVDLQELAIAASLSKVVALDGGGVERPNALRNGGPVRWLQIHCNSYGVHCKTKKDV